MNEEMILKLDAERRREIDSVKKDVENLMREDMKLDHKADLMLNEQRLLKERIEEGISKTVFSTSKKVDDILMQFGALKAENIQQDEKIKALADSQKTIQDDFKIMYRGIFFTGFIAAVAFIVKLILK